MRDLEPVDAAEIYLLEEADALDDIRENFTPAGRNEASLDDPQSIARSLLLQLALLRDHAEPTMLRFEKP